MNDFVDFMIEAMQGRDKQLGKSEAIPGQFEWENDFSTYAKENNLKSKKLSDEENEDLIIGQAFEMFLAGIGTSSSLFSCVTYFLAKEQNHQQQVYQEIKVCSNFYLSNKQFSC